MLATLIGKYCGGNLMFYFLYEARRATEASFSLGLDVLQPG